MNTDDIDLAYKVRRALNENLEHLPASTTERLAAARAQALARKKPDAPRRAAARRFDLRTLLSPVALHRFGVVAPLLVLVVGLAGVYQYEEQQHIAALAELEAAVLADELPLTAYTDDGFNAYLDVQQQKRTQ